MWTEQRPQDSVLNHWLVLDGETLPPQTTSVKKWKQQYSQPLSPEALLILVENIWDEASQYTELPVEEYGMQFMQGMSAISAGFFGSDQDRKELEPDYYLIIQSNCLNKHLTGQ